MTILNKKDIHIQVGNKNCRAQYISGLSRFKFLELEEDKYKKRQRNSCTCYGIRSEEE